MRQLLLYIIALLTLVGCANPGSGPDGGPYDETPPKIVEMTPALGTTGAAPKKVTITFDELIKVDNAQDNIIVSPPQTETPEIKTSGRHITVQFVDTLLPNTTYTVDFSDAIQDNNEGNPLGNFTYYFSTGEQLDTMEVAGRVLAANNLEPVKGILVGLHSNTADSAFTALPFDRVARTDASGHFSVKGVAPGSYRIYALKDIDNNFRFNRGEMIAFNEELVTPSSFPDVRYDTLWHDTVRIDTIREVHYTHYKPDDLVLLAFNETASNRQLLKTAREPEYFRVFFTAPSTVVPSVRGLNFNAEGNIIEDRNEGNDTITYWLRDTTLVNQDSLQVEYTYECANDSTYELEMRTDTLDLVPRFSYAKRQKFAAEDLAKFEKKREKRHKRGDYSQETPPVKPLALKVTPYSSLGPDENVRFEMEEPPVKIDTAGIHLYRFNNADSTYATAAYELEQVPHTLLKYVLKAEWRPGEKYILNVDSACIAGVSGKVNKPTDLKLNVSTTDTYGSLFFTIPDADSTTIVQLMQSDDRVTKQVRCVGGHADFFYLRPSDYYIRAFNDRNMNGKWDTGSYADHRQPETVYYYPQKITVRANWDIEQNWTLKAVPVDKQKPAEITKQKEEKKTTPKGRNAERERQLRNR